MTSGADVGAASARADRVEHDDAPAADALGVPGAGHPAREPGVADQPVVGRVLVPVVGTGDDDAGGPDLGDVLALAVPARGVPGPLACPGLAHRRAEDPRR